MTYLSRIAMSLLVVAFAVAGCAGQPSGGGWVNLIDGDKGLENFNRVGDANWRAEGGAIVADKGKGGYLVSKSAYKDFEIRAEFWADHTTNSGIRFRASDPNKLNNTNSYEANIYDLRADPLYGTGALSPDVAMVNPMPKAAGKWNVLEIHAKGSQLTVKLNGAVTVSVQDSKHASGGGDRAPIWQPWQRAGRRHQVAQGGREAALGKYVMGDGWRSNLSSITASPIL